jgi:hypothetical protein
MNPTFLSELPHAFCGFAATLMRDRLFVHRAMIDDSRSQSEHAQASSWLMGTYRREAFSFETHLPGSPELPGNFFGMTRSPRDRFYSYYSCGRCHRKGKSAACPGHHMPMSKLDHLIIANVKKRLFTGQATGNLSRRPRGHA